MDVVPGVLLGIPALLIASWAALRSGETAFARTFASIVLFLALVPAYLGIGGGMDDLGPGVPGLADLAPLLVEPTEWAALLAEGVLSSATAWWLLGRIEARGTAGRASYLAGRRVRGGSAAPLQSLRCLTGSSRMRTPRAVARSRPPTKRS